MRLSKSIVKCVMVMSLSMVLLSAHSGVTDTVANKCGKQASTENWRMSFHIQTEGNVPKEKVDTVCEIIRTKVSSEAWNFLVNSGGVIKIVEGDDIKDYIIKEYNCEEAKEVEEKIFGYCMGFDNEEGVLDRINIIVASEKLYAIEHEFFHALDYTHKYSKTEQFKALYENATSLTETLFKKEGVREHYMSNIEEFFAQTAKMYVNGELTGKYPELEKYYSNLL